jgi:cytochrome c oxidase cbb3-type subunit 2
VGFRQYKLGAAGVGLMLGFSMCITLFGPSNDFRSGVSTWVGLDKQLSLGRVIGFSYEDPFVVGDGKPLTVILNKDPKTGAPIDPPQRAYVYKPGIKFSPGVNHPDLLGPGVEELSLSVGKIGAANMSTGAVFTVSKGEFNGEEVDYIENATATRGWSPDATLRTAGDVNTRYVGKGKTIYISEGCWWCHTLLPEQTQDWQFFGAPPFLGDFNGEMPTAFGSDRKAPDLLHVASRNSSREWMVMHFFNPRLVQPNSIMPRFDYLWGQTDANGNKIDYAKWRADYMDYLKGDRIYAPDVPEPAPDSEVRALVDWILTSLK